MFAQPFVQVQIKEILAFVSGIHWWLMDSPHKGPVTWKIILFDDVIMLHISPWHKLFEFSLKEE